MFVVALLVPRLISSYLLSTDLVVRRDAFGSGRFDGEKRRRKGRVIGAWRKGKQAPIFAVAEAREH